MQFAKHLTNYAVILAFAAGLVGLYVGANAMWMDYLTSVNGYRLLRLNPVMPGEEWIFGAIPQVLSVFCTYLARSDKVQKEHRRWFAMTALVAQAADWYTDFTWRKQTTNPATAAISSFVIFTLGSEILTAISVAGILATLDDFLAALSGIANAIVSGLGSLGLVLTPRPIMGPAGTIGKRDAAVVVQPERGPAVPAQPQGQKAAQPGGQQQQQGQKPGDRQPPTGKPSSAPESLLLGWPDGKTGGATGGVKPEWFGTQRQY